MSMVSNYRRFIILLCGLIENLIFSGTVFGWPALFYMLKSEGIYEHWCLNVDSDSHHQVSNKRHLLDNLTTLLYDDTINDIDSNISEITKLANNLEDFWSPNETIYKTNDIQIIQDCTAQENILNLAYTIGIFSMGFTSFIWGFLLETWGLRIVRLLLNALITCGCILLCLTSKERSYLIVPAIILLGLAGVPLRIANMQIADYFPSKRSTVITFFSGAFSASPIVFVLLKYIYDSGVSFFTVILILVILSLFMIPFTLWLLPAKSVKSDDKIKPNIELNSYNQSLEKENLAKLSKETNGANGVTNGKHSTNGNKDEEEEVFIKSNDRPLKDTEDTSADVPLGVSLWSLSFTFHQLWFSWLNTYMVLYSGSMNLWLDRVTSDTAIAGGFTETFGIVQTSALVIAPIAGLFMDRNINRANKESDPFRRKLSRAQSGFIPILVTSIMLTLSVICRFFNTSSAVYSSIVFITLLRSFLVAVASAYIRIRFNANHFNRLNGIMCTTSAIFSLLQFPLFIWESHSHQHAFWVNMFCVISTIISFTNPLYLIITPLQKFLLRKEVELEGKSRAQTTC
ncbi:equilibrative nucleobase transporter 1-like [Oppia nitens]|uniref:equilibrative nucleobase transporter 1-like n=1 Tax=Oppia nitens TaxID=1686743 RepID=UPI0023DA19AD|nr:equilibrative nucleobase transporter 1-like [Oppia nitens]